MELDGTQTIKADRMTVWASLQDPDVLRSITPGCTEMTGTVDEGFNATVKQKIGPVKATFRCAVTVSDIVEGESCTISGEGKGGVAGFAKGHVKLKFLDSVDGTEIHYKLEARIGGKIAQLGSRLLGGIAKKLSKSFFSRLQEALAESD